MKKINTVKIILDILMTVVFVLLYNKRVFNGMAFHEIAGLAIGAVFIVHIALNWRWVKQVTLNIFSKNMSLKTKIGYCVDILLLFSIVYIIVSGILVSKIVFPNLGLGNNMFFKATHISISYLTLLLVGIHLGLHWDWVINTVKRILKINETKKAGRYVAGAAVIFVLVSGIYSMYTTSYLTKLPLVRSVVSGGQAPVMDKGGKAPSQSGEGRGQLQGGEQLQGRNINTMEVPNSTQGMRGAPMDGKGVAKVNPLNIMGTYTGIIAVFTIFTFYIEKLLVRMRINKKAI